MNKNLISLFASLAIGAATLHSADITVTPALAPNQFGSPSYSTWQSNALTALELGQSTYGDPLSPTYYSAAPTDLTVDQNVVTDFSSWMGVADPSGAFAGEYGNRLSFGVDIKGDGSLISISDLGFSAVSTDPSDSLGFGFGTGSYNYSAAYVGIIYGIGGGPDTFITSGPSTQEVNEIVGRGSGNAWEALLSDPTDFPGATPQAVINNVASDYDLGSGPFDFTGTYTLGTDSGSATVVFQTPDQASALTLFAASLGLIFLFQISIGRRPALARR
jgi:hypothetical protein